MRKPITVNVAAALHKVNYTGICGPLNFAAGPAPGVGIIPPVGAQWKKGTGKYPFEMQIVDNSLNKDVKVAALAKVAAKGKDVTRTQRIMRSQAQADGSADAGDLLYDRDVFNIGQA